MGVEPTTPTLQGSVAASGMQALTSRGPSGNRTRPPSLPRRYAAGTPTDHRFSDPGWNRTSDFLGVIQASSPLDHGIVLVTAAKPRGESGKPEPALDAVQSSISFPLSAFRSRLPPVAGPGIEPGTRALWEPARHLPSLQSSDEGESRTPTPPKGTTF